MTAELGPLAPAVILAGGLATRLHPVTERIPKSLVEVAGRPFIERQLGLLKASGVRRVILCLGHLGEMIRARLGDGSRLGLALYYSFDGPRPLGTGGALRRALPLLEAADAFFVLYGDSYLEVEYGKVEAAFRACGRPALMTIFRNEGRWETSNVLAEGDRVLRYDKKNPVPEMKHVDYGLGILTPALLKRIPPDAPCDLAELYAGLAEKGLLAAWEAPKRFYEIGSPEGLKEAELYLRNKEADTVPRFTDQYLEESKLILELLDRDRLETMVGMLADLRRQGGRLFILGVGGGAAHASHAVNDFRKLAGIEAYAPTDNASELTARTNDEGWDTVFASWLKGSRLGARDMIFIFSVGGGDEERNISPNLVAAIRYAKEVGARLVGIVGRDGGATARAADACLIVPVVSPERVTPHTEGFQALLWHLIVSHPGLKVNPAKWESAGGER